MKINPNFLLILFLIVIESLLFKMAFLSENFIIINLIMIVNILFAFFLLFYKSCGFEKKLNIIIFISFLIRHVALILDLYGYNIGFNGGDSDLFYFAAVDQIDYSNGYVSFLKLLFAAIGENRIVAQYFNIILSLFSVLIFKQILKFICSNNKQIFVSLCLFSFAPANILLCSALLRESIIIFCNCVSLFYFIKWYKKNKTFYFVLSFFFILSSSYFHSGMLLAIIGYAIAFILYNHEHKKIIFYKQTIVSIVLLIIVFLGAYQFFGDSVITKFNKIETLESISTKLNSGSTDYLIFTNNIESKVLIFVYTPLKILYFYFSPMIWDCYSFNVLLVFLFSSTIYLFLFFYITRIKSYDKSLKIILMIILFFLSVTFGWGCSNSGQAMRHREKILPFIIVLYSIKERKVFCKKERNE